MIDKKRIFFIDVLRGFSIICMIFYHGAYDLVDIFGINIPFFHSPTLHHLEQIFAGLFILISGVVSNYSKNNIQRGSILFGISIAVSLVTYFVIPDQLILFGILHLLSICMILYGITKNALKKVHSIIGILTFSFLFVISFNISYGYIGIAKILEIKLPNLLYNNNLGFPLGFINGNFYSSDYFPLFPWLFLFFIGSFIGDYFIKNKMPRFFYDYNIKAFSFIGRHSLVIYLVHQPLLFGIMSLLYYTFK